MDSVSKNQSLMDTDGMTTFEEKKDDEKQILQTIVHSCMSFSLLWTVLTPEQKTNFKKLCEQKYSTTNFLVRNSILKSVLDIIKS